MGIDPENLAVLQTRAQMALAVLRGVRASKETILAQYLTVGEYQAVVRGRFLSKTEYGRYLARNLPEALQLDTALRAHCPWLWRMAHDPESDIIDVLNHRLRSRGETTISTIMQYAPFAANPTAINHHYTSERRGMKSEGRVV